MSFIHKLAKEKNLKIVDAEEPLTLDVKGLDIARARQKNAKCCAYARACKRAVPLVEEAYFFRSTAYLQYGDRLVRYTLPVSMQKEIVSFDRAKAMTPGSYTLYAVPTSQKLDNMRRDSAYWHRRNRREKYRAKTKGPKRPVRRMNQTQGIRTFQDPFNEAS